MKYRRIGNTGLKVSEISLGSWMTYGDSVDKERSKECLVSALENGVNFIDTADIYANGEAERIIGEFLAEETYRRRDLVISTKAFWAMSDDVNDRGTSRKHLMESINDSLDRLNLDYVDIFFAHCYDRKTDLTESIGAMHDIVREGQAHYWGTSGFLGYQLERTVGTAREMKAYPPKVEQPRYNMLDRYIELEIKEVCKDHGIGIVVWSPLMYG
ncbi:MAG: aldo/keto reductase, partial [Candidatus Hodarchaeota archaeon]